MLGEQKLMKKRRKHPFHNLMKYTVWVSPQGKDEFCFQCLRFIGSPLAK